jgi:hypothetical protein
MFGQAINNTLHLIFVVVVRKCPDERWWTNNKTTITHRPWLPPPRTTTGSKWIEKLSANPLDFKFWSKTSWVWPKTRKWNRTNSYVIVPTFEGSRQTKAFKMTTTNNSQTFIMVEPWRILDGNRLVLRGCGCNNFMIFIFPLKVRPSGEISGSLALLEDELELWDDGTDDSSDQNFNPRFWSQF